jgi:hypothetical protein
VPEQRDDVKWKVPIWLDRSSLAKAFGLGTDTIGARPFRAESCRPRDTCGEVMEIAGATWVKAGGTGKIALARFLLKLERSPSLTNPSSS